MLATKEAQGDLVPLSANVIEWVYGSAEYVGSVFGTTKLTRSMIKDYYQQADKTWSKIEFNDLYGDRQEALSWLRASNIKGLDYYFPFGRKFIWFKNAEDAFVFALKFGATSKIVNN